MVSFANDLPQVARAPSRVNVRADPVPNFLSSQS